jgi:hypothetical protein
MTKNVPMFEVQPPPPLTLSKIFADQREPKGMYARYRPVKRVACDECVAVLHEARGVGPAPRGARWTRRTVKLLRLCQEHADLWRKVDGIGERK